MIRRSMAACFAQLAGDQVRFVLEHLLYAHVLHFHLRHLLPSQEIVPAQNASLLFLFTTYQFDHVVYTIYARSNLR